MTQKILVTGGTGYIGSHTVVQLLEAGYEVVLLDNLCNSKIQVLARINSITSKSVEFVFGDIRDKEILTKIFRDNNFSAVLHFAGLKAVGESEAEPDKYYENNVIGSANLIEQMIFAGVNKIIFSSSATVYGDPGYPKCTEETELNPQSEYGQNKKAIEELIKTTAANIKGFKYGILRYFNPVGAHISGWIGEDPNGVPNNLLPFVSQVAVGERDRVQVWGNDYETSDGTGKRDYIHVEDLATGHLAALTNLLNDKDSFTVNLGTGKSTSVLEVITAFEKASGKEIPYEISARRAGDVAENYADVSLAKELLGWSTKYDLDRMCADAWRWQSLNPNGYL
jgi:UDP-glucose 4-epimerase